MMKHAARILIGAISALAMAAAAGAPSDTVTTEHVTARLVAYAPAGVAAGKPLQVGLQLDHKDGWHTYWKNPGDSGLPVSMTWTLPSAARAGEIAWPVPSRLPFGPLMNYGYDGKVLLPVPVSVAATPAGAFDVRLQAEWLVCKEICLPESGEFLLQLPIAAPLDGERAAFEAATAAAPRSIAGAAATARVDAGTVEFTVSGLPAAMRGQAVTLFPENAGVFEHAAPLQQRWERDRLVVRAPLSAMRSESPGRLGIVLAQPGVAGGIAIEAGVAAWPPVGGASAAVPVAGQAPEAKPVTEAAADGGAIAAMLAFAFLGGALLNLMPCVFPVLSLKAVSLVQRGGGRGRMLAGGLAYTAGVLASFLALAGALLALRAGGSLIGWGFQLQSPQFVAALAVLFTLIGLNLLGVFEVGNLLPGRLASYRAKNPLLDDALTGAVAVAIASPCTAPLMGAAVGAALAAPWPLAMATFAALGLGMAAPYLALTAWPRLAAAIPRPGPWMVRFKSLLAFPMFATVVWLAWVLGQQAGVDGMAALLALLLAASLVAWLWASKPASTVQAVGGVAGLAVLAAVLGWAVPLLQPVPQVSAVSQSPGDTPATALWQAWSPQAVAQARGAGRPVFVDFTAAWCITCQFNKRAALSDPAVLQAMQERQVLLLRADWTNRDPVIARQLQELGRSGVPVYALYGPSGAVPQLLPEILSVEAIQSALSRM